MIKITCTSTDTQGKEIITRHYMIRTDEPHAIEFDSFVEDSIKYKKEARYKDIGDDIDWEHERNMEIEADIEELEEEYEDPIQD